MGKTAAVNDEETAATYESNSNDDEKARAGTNRSNPHFPVKISIADKKEGYCALAMQCTLDVSVSNEFLTDLNFSCRPMCGWEYASIVQDFEQPIMLVAIILQEGPAMHLCLVYIVCRSYEKKLDFAGAPTPNHPGPEKASASLAYDNPVLGKTVLIPNVLYCTAGCWSTDVMYCARRKQ